MGTQTFDPTRYFITLFGQNMVGVAKGTFITISYDSDFWEDVIGANGEAARMLTADRRATVKFTLQSDSGSNDVLDYNANLDQLRGQTTTKISCKDHGGTSIASGSRAWISKKPDQTFSSTEPTTREWTIRVADLDTTVGGRVGGR